jgi:hypothetical protein
MLHADDPSLLDYNRFRGQFGRAELVVLLVETVARVSDAPEATAPFTVDLTALEVDALFETDGSV